ncbi:MAG: helix-turn-helix domain-containing protein [Methanomassiliicoccales archaeon]|jgi:predicted DNA binding protein
MIIAKLSFIMPCNPVAQLSKATGHRVTVMRCVPSNKGGGQSLMKVESEDMDSVMLAGRLGKETTTGSFKVTTLAPGRHLVTAEHPTCEACRALAETRCFLEEGHGDEDGLMRWAVIAPCQDALRRLKELLEEGGTTVVLESVRQLKSERELTLHQEKVIKLAFDLGYYDIPRRIDLAKLGKILGVSKPTLDIMLRRAQRKVLASFLLAEG